MPYKRLVSLYDQHANNINFAKSRVQSKINDINLDIAGLQDELAQLQVTWQQLWQTTVEKQIQLHEFYQVKRQEAWLSHRKLMISHQLDELEVTLQQQIKVLHEHQQEYLSYRKREKKWQIVNKRARSEMKMRKLLSEEHNIEDIILCQQK